ncbi:MAG: 16S rRNA (cytosine(1402)-N(4))-methyltransferase RsmH [Clostridiales bacterium]|nr:16S rRNA (cytosine(1402)-N(4))-methyltransferase RsmH [Clostridiales bacterium]
MEAFAHQPVLLDEVLAALSPRSGGLYLDGTIGGAGHAEAILLAAPGARLIGLDQDEAALAASGQRLKPYHDRVYLRRSNFAQMAQALGELGFFGEVLDGVLLDIGVSSPQLDEVTRGFSYMQNAPLDMRMDRQRELTAADIVNNWRETELTYLLYEYGEEKWAKRIAAFIVAQRAISPIETTLQLVSVIKKAVPKGAREKDQHPAKRSFQALRIAVNDELTALEAGLTAAKELLKSGGRLAVISFHSLEDRIIKEKFRYWASSCICPNEFPVCVCGHKAEMKIINRRPVEARAAEVENNPRSRSAKLRVAEKI